MQHRQFMMQVLAHVRARFCGKQLNRSVYLKLASLQYKRGSGTDGVQLCFPPAGRPRPPSKIRSAAVGRVYCTKVLERSTAEIASRKSTRSGRWVSPDIDPTGDPRNGPRIDAKVSSRRIPLTRQRDSTDTSKKGHWTSALRCCTPDFFVGRQPCQWTIRPSILSSNAPVIGYAFTHIENPGFVSLPGQRGYAKRTDRPTP